MGRSERGAPAGAAFVPQWAQPAPPFSLPVSLLLDALAALVGAQTTSDVASACLPLLLDQDGVRGCALVQRDGRCAVVVGSAGYDCGSMAAGVTLPLDAGLPVTEAVRTGKLVVQGEGPSWLAVPFGDVGDRRAGALLLSLTSAPPQCPDELVRLHRLARAAGDALRRAAKQEEAGVGMSGVAAHLVASCPALAGHDVAVRLLPQDGRAGGDLVVCEPGRDGAIWLVVGDVCGTGLGGALTARAVAVAVRAVAPYARDPEELLAGVERAISSTIGPGSFVTAVAVLLSGDRLSVASAGHPVPLVLTASGVVAVLVEPGEPLALETGTAGVRGSISRVLPPDAVLLLHTDGLTDRRTPEGTLGIDPIDLVPDRWDGDGDLEALADAVLAGAEDVGSAGDDTALLLIRRSCVHAEQPAAQGLTLA